MHSNEEHEEHHEEQHQEHEEEHEEGWEEEYEEECEEECEEHEEHEAQRSMRRTVGSMSQPSRLSPYKAQDFFSLFLQLLSSARCLPISSTDPMATPELMDSIPSTVPMMYPRYTSQLMTVSAHAPST